MTDSSAPPESAETQTQLMAAAEPQSCCDHFWIPTRAAWECAICYLPKSGSSSGRPGRGSTVRLAGT